MRVEDGRQRFHCVMGFVSRDSHYKMHTHVSDGQESCIPASQLVPGDILFLKPGEQVCADCRLLAGLNVSVDESVFSGESTPVKKDPAFVQIESRFDAPYLLWCSTLACLSVHCLL